MMKEIYLSCPNLVLPCGKSDEELLDSMLASEKVCSENIIDIEELKKNRKFRRYDRFSIISELGAEKYAPEIGTYGDNRNIATVFSTSYGPIMTNINFISSIHNPGKVPSPTEFSHTVNNAALGHICKDMKLKGPSTQLLSSNCIGAAERMISSGSAEKAVVIGAEQYCNDMHGFFEEKGISVNEAVSGFVLTEKKTEHSVCRFISSYESNIGGHPIFDDESVDSARVKHSIERAVKKSGADPSKIKYAFVNTSDSGLLKTQTEAYKEISDSINVINLYDSIGEVLGAGLCAQAVSASFMFSCGRAGGNQLIFINNIDISGNYIVYSISGITS